MSRSGKIAFFFMGLTLFSSSILFALIYLCGSLYCGNGLLVLALMWCPGLCALVTYKLFSQSTLALGFKQASLASLKQGYLIPLLYVGLAYGILWLFRLGGFPNDEYISALQSSIDIPFFSGSTQTFLSLILIATFGVLKACLYALGEEIGWRGLLTSELIKNFDLKTTCLIVGALWGLWHVPIILISEYTSEAPLWYSISCFMALAMLLTFIYVPLRLNSNSIWPVVLLHASHNVFVQQIFTPLTKLKSHTAFFYDEFGILLVLSVLAVIIVLKFTTSTLDLRRRI